MTTYPTGQSVIRRARAAFRAVDGIPTDALESGVIGELILLAKVTCVRDELADRVDLEHLCDALSVSAQFILDRAGIRMVKAQKGRPPVG